MGAGKLRHIVDLQSQSTDKDSFGQLVPGAWTTVIPGLRANVHHQSGKEALRAGMDASSSMASVRIRFRKDIDAGMRLLFDGRTYDIKSVAPDEKGAYIDLVCETINLRT